MILGLALVLVVTVMATLLTLQGWKSRAPAFDMLTYFNSADNLLKRGLLPAYGDISSYGSFSPPGTAWLMAPGMLAFDDPRLYEKFGSGVLYFGTLLGVFLLTRACFGIWCAYLSVALYGLSGLGLSFAGSLWPIGHPFFYTWLVYLSIQWVTRNDARYLAAALFTWTVGMYQDMAITPAGLIIPTIWFLYRPPVFSSLLLVTGVLTLSLWYPYLQFEVTRGFADLKSQFLLHNISPANYRGAWCDPNLTLNHLENTSQQSGPVSIALQDSPRETLGVLDRLLRRAKTIVAGLLINFNEVVPLPGLNIVLLLLTLSSLVVLGLSRPFSWSVGFFVRNSLIPGWMTAMKKLWVSLASASTDPPGQKKIELLLLSLVVPWLILLAVAEPDRPERFFWLWPLQTILLAAFVTQIIPRLKLPSPVLGMIQLMLLITVWIHPLQSHAESWLRSGWAGSDPEEVYVVDYVANQLRAEGRNHTAIGYQLFIYEFMPKYNIIDSQYKVGAEFDLLFKYRQRISNTNLCAEGISPNDEYRIVQIKPQKEEGAPRQYFDVRLDESFYLLRQFGSYQVFKRDQNYVEAGTWSK